MIDSCTAGLRETAVTFAGPDGLQLAGILCEPTSCNTQSSWTFLPSQCAIMCHGFGSHKNGFHFPAIAQHLTQTLGLSSLRFDYSGNMDSPGPFRFGGFMKEVQQMVAAKQYLEQEHGKQVVLLLGHSRGAINATLYSSQQAAPPGPQQHTTLAHQQPSAASSSASTAVTSGTSSGSSSRPAACYDPVIPLVVLIAGRFDLTLNMTSRYGPDVLQQLRATGPWHQRCRRDGDGHEIHWTLSAEEMEERFALDIKGACGAISSMEDSRRPKVLVVHGAADPICEASDAAALAGHIAGAQLMEVEGADHWFKGRQQQLLDAVASFAAQAGAEKGLCQAAGVRLA